MAVRGYDTYCRETCNDEKRTFSTARDRGEDWMSIADDRNLVTRGQDFQEGNGMASERLGVDNDIAKTDFAHNGYEIVSEMGQTILAHETHLEEQQAQQTLRNSIPLMYNEIEQICLATNNDCCCKIPLNVARKWFCCGMLQDVAIFKGAKSLVYNMLHLL